MSDEIKAAAEGLRELSEKLADPELSDADAEQLAREASELAARGGALLDEQLRRLDENDPPTT